MQDSNQPKPSSRNAMGSRSVVSSAFQSDLLRKPGAPTVAYVGAAAGFGVAAGVAIALAASFAHFGSAAHVSRPASAIASGLPTLPAVYAATSPTLLASVEPAKKPSATPALVLASQTETSKPAPHKKHHHLWHWKKSSARRKKYVSPAPAQAVVDEPTGLEKAQAAAAAGPFFLGIEGDVTVASYDVASNRIQTYEGDNFIVDHAAASGGAIRWQDFPFNVHYRCDGMGQCTLMRGGAAEIAKLTR